jgi:hypothetical protein
VWIQVVWQKCEVKFIRRASRVCLLIQRDCSVQSLVADVALPTVSKAPPATSEQCYYPGTDGVEVDFYFEDGHGI